MTWTFLVRKSTFVVLIQPPDIILVLGSIRIRLCENGCSRKCEVLLGSLGRTAGCGRACPLVWEGWGREAPAYPDLVLPSDLDLH